MNSSEKLPEKPPLSKPPLSNRARTALERSIKHWERLLACETRYQFEKEGYGGADCPLCRLYNHGDSFYVTCGKCPVRERTGQHACAGTPYYAARHAILAFIFDALKTSPREEIQAELDSIEGALTRVASRVIFR